MTLNQKRTDANMAKRTKTILNVSKIGLINHWSGARWTPESTGPLKHPSLTHASRFERILGFGVQTAARRKQASDSEASDPDVSGFVDVIRTRSMKLEILASSIQHWVAAAPQSGAAAVPLCGESLLGRTGLFSQATGGISPCARPSANRRAH